MSRTAFPAYKHPLVSSKGAADPKKFFFALHTVNRAPRNLRRHRKPTARSMAPLTLIDILSNEYLLLHTTPYLLPTELLALGLCSHSYHSLITHSRSVWRHLNLSLSPSPQTVSTAIAQRTATPRYQSELHTLLQKPFVLRDVRTLVLDGLPVTVELLHDLLNGDRCRLQLLSIRECNMINERQLMQLFQYLVRPSRETPLSLKGCYWFGGMDAPGGIFPSELKPRDTSARGRFVSLENLDRGWVGILRACERTIAFDTRLCTGPRHDQGDGHFLEPQVANIRLAGDCSGCGSSPEARRGVTGLPKVVYPPVPLMSSDIRVACKPAGALEKDVLRCEDCAKDRWCERCGRWWCETCVARDSDKVRKLHLHRLHFWPSLWGGGRRKQEQD